MPQHKTQLLDSSLRQVIHSAELKMRPYDRYGDPRNDMQWLHLDGRAEDGFECFLLRLQPGASSTPHEHSGHEHFLVLDGELVDSDGAVFRAGDFVTFQPGSRHCSWTKTGCTLLVVLRGPNYAVDE